MKLKRVQHISENEAENLSGSAFTGMISITNTGRWAYKVFDERWGSVLRLEFDDVTPDIVRKFPESGWFVMTIEQAQQVLDWLHQHDGEFKEIVVHCAAGISRSAAVARFIAKRYRLPFDEVRGSLYNRHVFELLNELSRKEKKDGNEGSKEDS